jgi:membrane associated rhomboid family serine protease
MASFRDELRQAFRNGDTLNILILINVIVFLLFYVLDAVMKLFLLEKFGTGTLAGILVVPATFPELIFKPWSLITYQFLHGGFFHILFNMLVLFWMGKIFVEYLGMKKLLSTYILGGIAGALLFIISYKVVPLYKQWPAVPMLGASASVMAIAIAIASYIPDYVIHITLIGRVRLKYVALAFIVIDLMSISGSNGGGHMAHLGGALYGYLFAMNLKKGTNIASWFDSMADGIKNIFSSRKMKVVKKARPLTDDEYLHNQKVNQERVDSILDKISRSGYGSLTAEERDILFNYSNKK